MEQALTHAHTHYLQYLNGNRTVVVSFPTFPLCSAPCCPFRLWTGIDRIVWQVWHAGCAERIARVGCLGGAEHLRETSFRKTSFRKKCVLHVLGELDLQILLSLEDLDRHDSSYPSGPHYFFQVAILLETHCSSGYDKA
jgi:hypothetical protein